MFNTTNFADFGATTAEQSYIYANVRWEQLDELAERSIPGHKCSTLPCECGAYVGECCGGSLPGCDGYGDCSEKYDAKSNSEEQALADEMVKQ